MAIKKNLSSKGSWAKRAAAIVVFGAIVTVLSSCGGGGVASTATITPVPIPLAILPAAADVYPDLPTDFSITGGTQPYTSATSNAVVVPAPAVSGTTSTSAKITVIAKSVVADTPVTITIRDALGATSALALSVRSSTLNNTITLAPVAPTGTGCTGICSGGDALATVTAVLNGIKLINRPIRFEVFQGDFRFVTPGTGVLVTSLTINTDENGVAIARLQALVTAPTQVATFTATDTQTGLVRRFNFVIAQQTSGTGILSVLPSGTTTFTGAKPPAGQPAQCPFGGVVDMYIYGGTPPYTVVSPLPQYLSVSPSIVTTNGGRFSVTQSGCGSSQLIVTDAQNRVIETAAVASVLGPAGDAVAAPVPGSVTATPSAITLACNTSGQVNLSGSGTYTATISTAGVPATAFTVTPTSGQIPSTITLTRTNVGNGVPTTIQVNVQAASTTSGPATITVTVPANCP